MLNGLTGSGPYAGNVFALALVGTQDILVQTQPRCAVTQMSPCPSRGRSC